MAERSACTRPAYTSRKVQAACAAAILALAGCASQAPRTLEIDTSLAATAHSSRVQYIVVHYTAAPLARSVSLLTTSKVSAHYLITDEPSPRIMQLVDETRSAWHSGQSGWYGRSWLNANAIGIEIVNAGYEKDAGGDRQWAPYADAQIERTIALIGDIARRHDISPENIVGHSDIAPQRKVDPGPMFPWERLARAGLGRWFDPTALEQAHARLRGSGTPDVLWFQRMLRSAGYDIAQHGQLDEATRRVLAAFQMHYRPQLHDGLPDQQTAAILMALPALTGTPRISGGTLQIDDVP